METIKRGPTSNYRALLLTIECISGVSMFGSLYQVTI